MFHISKLKALGMPETGKMKTAVPRISVKLSCRSQSVSETSIGLRGSFAMNENFLGFQLAREEHNASIFYHESAERRARGSPFRSKITKFRRNEQEKGGKVCRYAFCVNMLFWMRGIGLMARKHASDEVKHNVLVSKTTIFYFIRCML